MSKVFSNGPDFINYYAGLNINQDALDELRSLNNDYLTKKKELETWRDRQAAGYQDYQNKMGKRLNADLSSPFKKLDAEFALKAKIIAQKHADKEEMKIDEWKEPKSLGEQMSESDKHIDERQEILAKMLENRQKDREAERGL